MGIRVERLAARRTGFVRGVIVEYHMDDFGVLTFASIALRIPETCSTGLPCAIVGFTSRTATLWCSLDSALRLAYVIGRSS
jgi:hypothetical protein